MVLDHYMTTDLRACEEPHFFLGVGQFSGARTDCRDKQSTELLSWDIINSINFYLEGMEGGRRGEEGEKEGRGVERREGMLHDLHNTFTQTHHAISCILLVSRTNPPLSQPVLSHTVSKIKSLTEQNTYIAYTQDRVFIINY